MTEHSRYFVIAAETYAAKKRYRILIEEALHQGGISPALRMELEQQLKYAIIKEGLAHHDLETAEDEEEAEKKKKGKGGDSSGGEGESGGQQDGGSAGDASGGGMKIEDNAAADEYAGFEMLALLLLLDKNQNAAAGQEAAADEQFLAAATFLFDRDENAVHIHEPYMPDPADAPDATHDFLPALERHAVTMGAQQMHLRAHADVVEAIKKKYGYQLLGAPFTQGGVRLQRMTKSLKGASAVLKNVIC